MAYQAPSKVGDTHPLISEAKKYLQANFESYAAGVDDGTDVWTPRFDEVFQEWSRRVHTDIVKGRRSAPDVAVPALFDWRAHRQMKLTAPPAAPPPPVAKRRHPAYVFRGTGGVIGQDLVSLVCQGASDLVEEINPPWAATMGGIPVGTAGGIGDPSMWSAVQATVTWTQNDIVARIQANPGVQIIVGGYSAGAIVAGIIIDWLKANFPDNYLCSFSFGDPTRPFGGGFFGRPAPWGRGISTVQYGDPYDWRHCWLTHEGDMYAQVPGGVVGDIMDDIYEEVTRFAFKDILTVAIRIVQAVPVVMKKAGITIPELLGALSGGLGGLVVFGFLTALKMLDGFIPGGKPDDQLKDEAAAARAAVIALGFLFAGTGPHIRYHLDAAWPGGPTFVQLGVQHVRDYAQRVLAI